MTMQATTEMIIAELRVLPAQDRLLGLYGLGIDGCERNEGEQVQAVLDELIASLDFSYGDIAEAFQQLYAYCLAQCGHGALESVAFVLADLRATLLRAAETAQLGEAAGA
jgi:hypothetical protein